VVLAALVVGACCAPVATTARPTATDGTPTLSPTVGPAACPTATLRSYVIALTSDFGSVQFVGADGATVGPGQTAVTGLTMAWSRTGASGGVRV